MINRKHSRIHSRTQRLRPRLSGHVQRREYTDFDLYNPFQQSFPASIAEVTAAGFSPNVLAGWAMQETSGTTLADFSGNGLTLTKNGAATKVLFGQRAVGLFDGVSFRSQRCFEAAGGGAIADRAELASTASLDMDWTAPRAVLICFRAATAQAGSVTLFGKFAGANGWTIYMDTSGIVHAYVASAGGSVDLTAAGNYSDGAWHWIYARYDPVADTVKLDTDLTTGASASAVAVTNPSNAVAVSLGGCASNSPAAGQYRGVIVFGDVSTTVAQIQTWWRHGRAPAWLTYSRASSFHAPVADDTVEGDVVTCWASGQMAYEHNALISTNPLRLGAPIDTAHTNLIPNTDVNNTTNWATSGGTRAIYDADSVRGFREASKHTKTAAGDMVLAAVANGAAVTASTVYTASIWCRWDGVGTAPELRVYRADGTTLIGTTSATVSTNKRRRLTHTFTAPATESVRVAWSGAAAASTSGGAWFEEPQVNTENYAKPWIQTKGATASTVATVMRATVPGLTTERGTIKAWLAYRAPGAGGAFARYTAQTAQAPGTLARARLLGAYGGAGGHVIAAYDDAGAFVTHAIGAAVDGAVENISRGMWDRGEANGWSLRQQRNAAAASTNNVDLPAGGPCETLYLGSYSGGNQTCGLISKVRVWRSVELSA